MESRDASASKKLQGLERKIIHESRREDQSKKVKSEEGILDNRKSMVWVVSGADEQRELAEFTPKVDLNMGCDDQ